MASSLDDMEAYELLQIELDRFLQKFLTTLPDNTHNKAALIHFLNHWIEYICFQRHLSNWEVIVSKHIEDDFWSWYSDLMENESPREIEYRGILKDFQLKFSKA